MDTKIARIYDFTELNKKSGYLIKLKTSCKNFY